MSKQQQQGKNFGLHAIPGFPVEVTVRVIPAAGNKAASMGMLGWEDKDIDPMPLRKQAKLHPVQEKKKSQREIAADSFFGVV